jgi:hypothetical protein
MPTERRLLSLNRGDRRVRTAAIAAVVVVVVAVAGTVAVRLLGDPVVVNEQCSATANGETFELAPDQAGNAALITALAVHRGLPARAATIAIATAIQESKLRNISYGDRDSLGLFQQRPSQGWGTPEQVMDPVYATNAFYDGLVQIDGYETMEITAAAQSVQRSGFPEAYADHEPEGRAFASALTGYSPAALDCRLRAVDDPPATDEESLLPQAAAVQSALDAQLGGVSWDSSSGARLVGETSDSEDGARRAWAVAQWAVASAAAYDIVAVEVDGRTWRRDAPDDGWADQPDSPQGAGQVSIEVASA